MMNYHRFLFLVLIFTLQLNALFAQNINIAGKIIDGENAEPLAFVNIVLKGHNRGSISDIDGKWKIDEVNTSDTLIISLVGYTPIKATIATLHLKYPSGTIKMYRSSYNLKEVVVLPGINPAHRIIKKAIDHKKKNNWERLPQWEFTTYCRFHITNDVLDSEQAALEKERRLKQKNNVSISLGDKIDTFKTKDGKDSIVRKSGMEEILAKQHLFIIESVTDKKFKYPDKVKETVIASKTSGSADPRFSYIFQETNNFNIYKDYIEMGDKKYLSPLAYGAIAKYLFILEDSIRSGNDTVYVISFRPHKSTLFDGFAGLIYISTHGYAVQNVTALPRNIEDGFNTEIQQQFKIINGFWFPEQITTKIVFGGDINAFSALVGKGKTYIKDVNLQPDFSKQKFNNITFDISKTAANKTDSFWDKRRNDSLSNKDKETYKVIDSIGKAIKLDQKIKYFEALLNGRLGIGIFDIPFNRILDYNGYEGFRLGSGLYTNNKLANWFSVGGYGAYGFKDHTWKYGTELFLTPFEASPFKIKTAYYSDVSEIGAVAFPMDRNVTAEESIRNLNVTRMYSYKKAMASICISPFRYMLIQPAYSQSIESMNSFAFINEQGQLKNQFRFSEVSLGFKYAYKEKFVQLMDKRYSEGTAWPILWVNLTQGLNSLGGGEYNYKRIDAKLEKQIPIKLAGHSNIQIRAGYVDGRVPLLRLFNGNGDKGALAFASENIFETMRPYDFFSTKYVAAFWKHSFEKLLFKYNHFEPVLNLHFNAGIGQIDHPEWQQGMGIRSMNKGYYEAGISVDNIIKSLTGGFGAGVFYRVGPYMDAKPINNIMFKLVFVSKILGQ